MGLDFHFYQHLCFRKGIELLKNRRHKTVHLHLCRVRCQEQHACRGMGVSGVGVRGVGGRGVGGGSKDVEAKKQKMTCCLNYLLP